MAVETKDSSGAQSSSAAQLAARCGYCSAPSGCGGGGGWYCPWCQTTWSTSSSPPGPPVSPATYPALSLLSGSAYLAFWCPSASPADSSIKDGTYHHRLVEHVQHLPTKEGLHPSEEHLKANYVTTLRKGCPSLKAPPDAAHECSFCSLFLEDVTATILRGLTYSKVLCAP